MTFRPMFAGLTALAVAACETGPATSGGLPKIPRFVEPALVDSTITLPGGPLLQRVTVVPRRLARGDTILVRSVLLNQGTAPVGHTSTICGVHLAGTLAFDDPFVRCAGYSMSGDLAPGDSVVDARLVVVTSSLGSWVLEVRHLLEPSTWLTVTVEVVAP
jgi:hypothetical protein